MKKTVREHLNRFFCTSKAWIARRLHNFARSLELRQELPDDPLIDVLHQAISNRTGKLRMSDAYLICGIEPGKANQDQINRFGKAIRELGWERQRRRFDGSLQYAYVKGNEKEREVELVVEYDPHMRSVRIEIDKNAQPPPTPAAN